MKEGRGAVDGQSRERNGNIESRRVSKQEQQRQRQRQLQWDVSGGGSVAAGRGLEGAAREAAWWRVGKCAATGQQRERERAVAVADAGSVEKCRR